MAAKTHKRRKKREDGSVRSTLLRAVGLFRPSADYADCADSENRWAMETVEPQRAPRDAEERPEDRRRGPRMKAIEPHSGLPPRAKPE